MPSTDDHDARTAARQAEREKYERTLGIYGWGSREAAVVLASAGGVRWRHDADLGKMVTDSWKPDARQWQRVFDDDPSPARGGDDRPHVWLWLDWATCSFWTRGRRPTESRVLEALDIDPEQIWSAATEILTSPQGPTTAIRCWEILPGVPSARERYGDPPVVPSADDFGLALYETRVTEAKAAVLSITTLRGICERPSFQEPVLGSRNTDRPPLLLVDPGLLSLRSVLPFGQREAATAFDAMFEAPPSANARDVASALATSQFVGKSALSARARVLIETREGDFLREISSAEPRDDLVTKTPLYLRAVRTATRERALGIDERKDDDAPGIVTITASADGGPSVLRASAEEQGPNSRLEAERRALLEVGEEVRQVMDVLAGTMTSQQILQSRQQAAQGARFERLATVLASAVIGPALIAAIFGANVRLPGQGTSPGLGGMLLLMVATGILVYGLLRAFESGSLLPSLRAVGIVGIAIGCVAGAVYLLDAADEPESSDVQSVQSVRTVSVEKAQEVRVGPESRARPKATAP